MADSSGQPAAQRIGALRVNDCRWGRLAQNFSRNPRPVPSYPCTVVVSSVRETAHQLPEKRSRDSRGLIDYQPRRLFFRRQQRIGRHKAQRLPGKAGQHLDSATRWGGDDGLAPSWRKYARQRGLPRPRSAVTAAIPGGRRISCSRIAACSACGRPSAGCQSGRGAASGKRGRSDCRQSNTSGSAINCRQQR